MTSDETYMSRCLQLAGLGLGRVAPNPMVGAVLVHEARIIGEGFHRAFGGPHAEVECLESVKPADRHLIHSARMYVSLEPCAHHGKTPPCADRILREGIHEVVVGCRDPFPMVDGRGIERLRAEGVSVRVGVLSPEAEELNRRFLTMHREHRPYVVLKWAESVDGMMSGPDRRRTAVSGPVVNRLVHRWRSEEQAILVGSGTALTDDPSLTSRIPGGRDPLRIVIDRRLKLPRTLRLLSDGGRTMLINTLREGSDGPIIHRRVSDSEDFLAEALRRLYEHGIQSVLVEGGRKIHDAFLNSGLWDECRIIRSLTLRIPDGYPAPQAPQGQLISSETWDGDRVDILRRIPVTAIP